MKTLKNITVILFIINYSNLVAQVQCGDIFSAETALAAANASLLGCDDCYVEDRNLCYQTAKLFWDAADRVSHAYNAQTPRGCYSCSTENAQALLAIANAVQAGLNTLHSLGYPKYNNGTNAADLMRQAMLDVCPIDDPVTLSQTPDLTGTWCVGVDTKIDITFDKINRLYTFRMYNPSSSTEYTSTARYTDDFTIFADTWGATGHIYDGAIVFNDQTWSKCPSEIDFSKITKPQFYLVKVAGGGWRKAYGGAHKISGHYLKLFEVNEGESLQDKIDEHRKYIEDYSEKYCKSGPPSCPCSSVPYIWTSGPTFSLVDQSDSKKELWNGYSCDDSNYTYGIVCRDFESTWIDAKKLPANLCSS